jgi:hypothetical protein
LRWFRLSGGFGSAQPPPLRRFLSGVEESRVEGSAIEGSASRFLSGVEGSSGEGNKEIAKPSGCPQLPPHTPEAKVHTQNIKKILHLQILLSILAL